MSLTMLHELVYGIKESNFLITPDEQVVFSIDVPMFFKDVVNHLMDNHMVYPNTMGRIEINHEEKTVTVFQVDIRDLSEKEYDISVYTESFEHYGVLV